MENVAKNIYPWLPVKYLLKDKYNSERKIKEIKSPILILHGEKDTIVTFSVGKEFFMANEPKFSYFTKDDDHMMKFDENLINSIKDF